PESRRPRDLSEAPQQKNRPTKPSPFIFLSKALLPSSPFFWFQRVHKRMSHSVKMIHFSPSRLLTYQQ
ncbi:MAG: hypothetical protein E7C36_17175, partial [Mixta calida]|nr:hypothetical protein [Mixta calida]